MGAGIILWEVPCQVVQPTCTQKKEQAVKRASGLRLLVLSLRFCENERLPQVSQNLLPVALSAGEDSWGGERIGTGQSDRLASLRGAE